MASTSNSGRKPAFDEIAPSASTSASKWTQKPCYDVFINHRGPDVKQTVASVLYGILTAISLSVFLDSEELECGDFLPRTIEAAMASALLHIAIFSKSYADSPWCLAELSFMVESGAKIIPIFYHVDPSDLRWVDQRKGIYVDAFKKHEQKGRYSQEKLEEWKSALHKVSFYHGLVINSKEDEARLMKNIVNMVLKETKNEPFVVAKHPVGLEEMVEDFKANTLQSAHGNQEVQIVGIWGMGGSGKTTLAKQLYNEISSSMDKSSLVFNVRDAATKGLLHEKQKVLLRDLGMKDLAFDNIEEGKRSLSRGLRSVKALIILDDVDNIEQLDVLLPTKKENLGRGSLIIVTTRTYAVLKAWDISTTYKMRLLNSLYAKQLFCWQAFLNSSPPDEFMKLVEKFLKVCQGLPLSLEIFGAQLHGESRKEFWESLLQEISKILPDDIKNRLKISYDALKNEEKEMFVDIACFFIGKKSSLAIEVWNGLGWNGLWNWEGLLHKCLVELDNDNLITMHDHLRDLGRDIAKNQSPYRFWIPQQINVQKQNKKEISIQGIITTSSQFFSNKHQKVGGKCLPRESGELEEFGVRCSQGKLVVNTNKGIWSLTPSSAGLKYLVIDPEISRVPVIASERSLETLKLPSGLSRELVWLSWFEIGRSKLPSGFSLKNLRVLQLSEEPQRLREHHLEELWGEAEGEAPLQLRQLHLSGCHEFKGFPKSIRHLNYLTEIVITEGYSVRSLPDEFCLIQSLEYLVLNGCRELSSLPNNFGNLRNLRHLSLSDCWKLRRLPVSFQNLMLLEHLHLMGCSDLKFTSEDISFLESLTKLEYLNLFKCKQLEELPCPASLRTLRFSLTSLRELPDKIGQLSKLRAMQINNMLSTCLPISLGDLSSLTSLFISWCGELERLPDSLGGLSSLTSLDISQCGELERLPDSLGDLSSLTWLYISQCGELKRLPDSLGDLSSLTWLSISECGELKRLPDSLGGLSSLTHLSISQCGKLERLPASLGDLSSLTNLEISQCPELQLLPDSLGDLSSLLNLEISQCGELERLPDSLGDLSSLTYISIKGCPKLENLYVCPSLQGFHFSETI